MPWFNCAGFVFAAVAKFTGQPTSSRGPGLFSNLPLYAVASILTGLVLWSLTLLWSFRRLLVFDRGLLYRYSQKHAARAIFWEDIDAGSLRSVVAPAGTDAGRPLRFFTFTTRNSPDQLVGKIQEGLINAGVPEAAAAFHALPPAVVRSAVSLD